LKEQVWPDDVSWTLGGAGAKPNLLAEMRPTPTLNSAIRAKLLCALDGPRGQA
jgi:hypothetical protein